MLTQQLFKKRLLDVVLAEIRESDSIERKIIVHETVPIGTYRGLCLKYAGASIAEDTFRHFINTLEKVKVDAVEQTFVIGCKDVSIEMRHAGSAPAAWETACTRLLGINRVTEPLTRYLSISFEVGCSRGFENIEVELKFSDGGDRKAGNKLAIEHIKRLKKETLVDFKVDKVVLHKEEVSAESIPLFDGDEDEHTSLTNYTLALHGYFHSDISGTSPGLFENDYQLSKVI